MQYLIQRRRKKTETYMPIDASIRVSFQSNTQANQAANQALVGHPQNKSGNRPFVKVGTALYTCRDAAESDVAESIALLGSVLSNFPRSIDSVWVSIVRKR